MKQIKVTHEECVKSGDLVLIDEGFCPIYMSLQAQALAKKSHLSHKDLSTEATYLYLMTMPNQRKPGYRKPMLEDFDLVFGLEIRDDDLQIGILTVVERGED